MGELTQNDRFLAGQNSCLQQLRKHSLHPVRMLANIFNKQDSVFNSGQVRRSRKRRKHCKIASPQHRIVDGIVAFQWLCAYPISIFCYQINSCFRQPPATALALPCDQVVKAGLHDVICPVLGAKIVHQCRAGPRCGASSCHQRHLKRGEIAETDKMHAFFNGLGDRLVVDCGQQPGQPITAA